MKVTRWSTHGRAPNSIESAEFTIVLTGEEMEEVLEACDVINVVNELEHIKGCTPSDFVCTAIYDKIYHLLRPIDRMKKAAGIK